MLQLNAKYTIATHRAVLLGKKFLFGTKGIPDSVITVQACFLKHHVKGKEDLIAQGISQLGSHPACTHRWPLSKVTGTWGTKASSSLCGVVKTRQQATSSEQQYLAYV